MAEVSKIVMPDNTSYDLKVYTNHIAPMKSKTFSEVIGSNDTASAATFYFGVVKPTNFYSNWKIKYNVYIQASGHNDSKAISEVIFTGSKDVILAYSIFNSIADTQYRPASNHIVYTANSQGVATYGHALGVGLQGSWNPATAGNVRTLKIEILECTNCNFEFFNAALVYDSIPGTGTTNYSERTEYDFATQGLQETGDKEGITDTIGGFSIDNQWLEYLYPVTQGVASNQYNFRISTNLGGENALFIRKRLYDGSSFGNWTNVFKLPYNGNITTSSSSIDYNTAWANTGSTISPVYFDADGAPAIISTQAIEIQKVNETMTTYAVSCYRYGNVVTLHLDLRKTSGLAASTQTVIARVPTGSRPPVDVKHSSVDSNGAYIELFVRTATGNISIYPRGSASSGLIRVQLTWIV